MAFGHEIKPNTKKVVIIPEYEFYHCKEKIFSGFAAASQFIFAISVICSKYITFQDTLIDADYLSNLAKSSFSVNALFVWLMMANTPQAIKEAKEAYVNTKRGWNRRGVGGKCFTILYPMILLSGYISSSLAPATYLAENANRPPSTFGCVLLGGVEVFACLGQMSLCFFINIPR